MITEDAVFRVDGDEKKKKKKKSTNVKPNGFRNKPVHTHGGHTVDTDTEIRFLPFFSGEYTRKQNILDSIPQLLQIIML